MATLENFWPADDFEQMAGELIQTDKKFEMLKDLEVRICYLMSDKEKRSNGKTVFADTEKVKRKQQTWCHYDFIITFYAPNIISLNEKQLWILVEHELLHCGVEPDDKGGYICSIRPHDFDDFREIIQEHGVWWSEEQAQPSLFDEEEPETEEE